MVAAWIVVMLSTLWTLAGLVALARVVHPQRRLRAPARSRPISVLKPLAGADAGLERDLASLFEQDHPEYELLFGVHDPADPAIAVVRRLMDCSPRARARLVVHGTRALDDNPKVDNLRRLLEHARHELILVSDSNVRAPRHYLTELAATFDACPGVGLVTNVFAGVGERSLGAALDNVQLNGFCAAGATLPSVLGDPLVVGKSMLFSRIEFERLGGFERVSHLLAEDFVIGKMFQHAGLAVSIAPTVLRASAERLRIRAFFARHLRWSMIRWRLRPFAALLEPLTAPLLLLPVATFAWGATGLGWIVCLWLVRDAGGWLLLRGPRRLWLPVLLGPLRDAIALCAWLVAPFKRHITWRGRRVRVGAGTFLYAEPRARPS